jgi:hypothetical protein
MTEMAFAYFQPRYSTRLSIPVEGHHRGLWLVLSIYFCAAFRITYRCRCLGVATRTERIMAYDFMFVRAGISRLMTCSPPMSGEERERGKALCRREEGWLEAGMDRGMEGWITKGASHDGGKRASALLGMHGTIPKKEKPISPLSYEKMNDALRCLDFLAATKRIMVLLRFHNSGNGRYS